MLLHVLRLPRHPLSLYVENFWLWEGDPGYTREKILPDGAIELIIDLGEGPKRIYEDEAGERFRTCSRGWISGERTRHIVIGAESGSMIGIRFRPGGAYPFFRFPISELTDSVIELDLVWGRLLAEIRERVLEAATPDEKLGRLETFLRARAERSLEPNRSILFAVQQLQHSPQSLAIRDLAQRIGISQKHLIDQFERTVGLRPKTFARICKFQNVLALIERARVVEWAELAQDCGYYDQAHLIKEFKAFSGLTPSVYQAQRGEYLNFIPLDRTG